MKTNWKTKKYCWDITERKQRNELYKPASNRNQIVCFWNWFQKHTIEGLFNSLNLEVFNHYVYILKNCLNSYL